MPTPTAAAFLLSYLLSAAAVFVALLPMAMGRADLETPCALLELVILGGILLSAGLGAASCAGMSAGWNAACWLS